MNILVNISNLKIGGALQVAYSFVMEILNFNSIHEFHIVISKEVENELKLSDFISKNNFNVYQLNSLPSPFFKGNKARVELGDIERQSKADIVLSIFGPTYWKPKSLHVCGFAAGWTINPDSVAFQALSNKNRVKKKVQNYFKLRSLIRESSIFIVETETVRVRLNKYANVDLEDVFVVGNTYGNQFLNDDTNKKSIISSKKKNDEFRFVSITANYPHKNLSIIKSIVPILRENKIKATFYLTINEIEFQEIFKDYEDYVINLGPIKVKDCPLVYRDADALFLPTLLESFTASYPEAMISHIPILTSDLDFAHDICQDAACYFNPLDPFDIASKIAEIVLNKKLYNNLVKKGVSRVLNFPTARERAEQYISICEKAIKERK